MEQEIYDQTESTGKLIKLFQGGSNSGRYMEQTIRQSGTEDYINHAMLEILGLPTLDEKQARFDDLCKSKEAKKLLKHAQENYSAIFDVAIKENFEQKYFFSDDKNVVHRATGQRV